MYKKTLFLLAVLVTAFAFTAHTVSAQRPSTLPQSASRSGLFVSCAARKEAVQQRSLRLVDHAQDIVDTFDAIVVRVKQYYIQNNLQVADYDALLAAITAKKAAVDTAAKTAQATALTFSCETGNIKETVTTYNSQMRVTIDMLGEYKTAVRNLIVAVHTAGKNTTNE